MQAQQIAAIPGVHNVRVENEPDNYMIDGAVDEAVQALRAAGCTGWIMLNLDGVELAGVVAVRSA
jgi:hypothetical protein